MLKKMMLLAMAVGALVAFAAPAAAQADHWSTAGNYTFNGVLTATAPGLEATCGVTAEVEATNPGGSATGETLGAALNVGEEGCEGVFGGGLVSCPILPGSSAEGGHIHVATGASGIQITEAGFIDVFGPNCPGGAAAAAFGTLTGTWVNATSCIEFNEAGDLFAPTSPPTEVKVDGELCEETGTLKLEV